MNTCIYYLKLLSSLLNKNCVIHIYIHFFKGKKILIIYFHHPNKKKYDEKMNRYIMCSLPSP